MRQATQNLRAAVLGLNLLLLGGVGLLSWDLTRARDPGLPAFDPLKYALDDQSAGSTKDRSVIWRELDVPRPKQQQNPKTVIEAPAAAPACPWTLALVLMDEERPDASSVILKDRGGRQTAVGVGKHVDPARRAFRLKSVRIESEDDQVHAVATLVRVADERAFELRLSRTVPTATPDN